MYMTKARTALSSIILFNHQRQLCLFPDAVLAVRSSVRTITREQRLNGSDEHCGKQTLAYEGETRPTGSLCPLMGGLDEQEAKKTQGG